MEPVWSGELGCARAQKVDGDTVRCQPTCALETPQRIGCRHVEAPVDRSRREPEVDEAKLERRHVPADQPGPQLALPEQRLPEHTERASRPRTDAPGGPDAVLALQAKNAGVRLGTRDAVDRARVKTVGAETDLEGRHAAVRSQRRSCDCERQYNHADERRPAASERFRRRQRAPSIVKRRIGVSAAGQRTESVPVRIEPGQDLVDRAHVGRPVGAPAVLQLGDGGGEGAAGGGPVLVGNTHLSSVCVDRVRETLEPMCRELHGEDAEGAGFASRSSSAPDSNVSMRFMTRAYAYEEGVAPPSVRLVALRVRCRGQTWSANAAIHPVNMIAATSHRTSTSAAGRLRRCSGRFASVPWPRCSFGLLSRREGDGGAHGDFRPRHRRRPIA